MDNKEVCMYSPLKNREGIKETRPIKLWQRLLRLLLEEIGQWGRFPSNNPRIHCETHFGSSPLMVSKVASSQRQRTINWSSLKPTAIPSMVSLETFQWGWFHECIYAPAETTKLSCNQPRSICSTRQRLRSQHKRKHYASCLNRWQYQV